MSHEPDLKEKFIKSIAPSIFGHDGIVLKLKNIIKVNYIYNFFILLY